MKRMIVVMMVAALVAGGAAVQAAQDDQSGRGERGGRCSPEGTWYGYNSEGNLWIVTISRSGPKSFTTVMDNGANLLFPGAAQSTDWRGEFVRSGPWQYAWTTMAYWRAEDDSGFPPFVLGFCPLTAEFDDCDSFQGGGICDLYGIFDVTEDPFETGLYLGSSSEPLFATFKRMPMTYPEE